MDGETRQGIRTGLGVFLAHHPLCGDFRQDRFHVGAWGFCSGCVVAVPAVVVGLVAALRLLNGSAPPAAVLGAGLVLGLPQLTTYVWRRSRIERATAKLLGGLGLGAVLAAWIFLPLAMVVSGLALAAFGVALLGLQAIRVRSILRTCDRCPWRRDWDHCPGFVRSEFALATSDHGQNGHRGAETG